MKRRIGKNGVWFLLAAGLLTIGGMTAAAQETDVPHAPAQEEYALPGQDGPEGYDDAELYGAEDDLYEFADGAEADLNEFAEGAEADLYGFADDAEDLQETGELPEEEVFIIEDPADGIMSAEDVIADETAGDAADESSVPAADEQKTLTRFIFRVPEEGKLTSPSAGAVNCVRFSEKEAVFDWAYDTEEYPNFIVKATSVPSWHFKYWECSNGRKYTDAEFYSYYAGDELIDAGGELTFTGVYEKDFEAVVTVRPNTYTYGQIVEATHRGYGSLDYSEPMDSIEHPVSRTTGHLFDRFGKPDEPSEPMGWFEAVPSAGFLFSHWELDGEAVGEHEAFPYGVFDDGPVFTEDAVLTAVFVPDPACEEDMIEVTFTAEEGLIEFQGEKKESFTLLINKEDPAYLCMDAVFPEGTFACKDGFIKIFRGWYYKDQYLTDDNLFTPDSNLLHSITEDKAEFRACYKTWEMPHYIFRAGEHGKLTTGSPDAFRSFTEQEAVLDYMDLNWDPELYSVMNPILLKDQLPAFDIAASMHEAPWHFVRWECSDGKTYDRNTFGSNWYMFGEIPELECGKTLVFTAVYEKDFDAVVTVRPNVFTYGTIVQWNREGNRFVEAAPEDYIEHPVSVYNGHLFDRYISSEFNEPMGYFSAVPSPGFVFKRWELNGAILEEYPEYPHDWFDDGPEFTEDAVLTAVFEPDPACDASDYTDVTVTAGEGLVQVGSDKDKSFTIRMYRGDPYSIAAEALSPDSTGTAEKGMLYEFLGWYRGEELITEDKLFLLPDAQELAGLETETVTYTAKYKKEKDPDYQDESGEQPGGEGGGNTTPGNDGGEGGGNTTPGNDGTGDGGNTTPGNNGGEGGGNAAPGNGSAGQGTVPAKTSPDTISGSVTDTAAKKNSDGLIEDAAALEKLILAGTSEEAPEGAAFGKLKFRVAKAGKTSIKLKWKKVKGASGYILYGSRCGKKYKMQKIADLTKPGYTAKKLKKGTYYKFILVAYKGSGSNRKAVACAKTLHVATGGGKVGNFKSMSVKSKKKLTLKAGKTSKIKLKVTKPSGVKVKKHRAVRYESSNKKVATVTSKGKIKAVGKGKCTIFFYTQNGLYKSVKVTVK